jgi:hypothetical protein
MTEIEEYKKFFMTSEYKIKNLAEEYAEEMVPEPKTDVLKSLGENTRFMTSNLLKEGYVAGATEYTRWRSFSEEKPEGGEKKYGDLHYTDLLIKKEDGEVFIATYCFETNRLFKEYNSEGKLDVERISMHNVKYRYI